MTRWSADPPDMWARVLDTRDGWLLLVKWHERELPGCLINMREKALPWLRARGCNTQMIILAEIPIFNRPSQYESMTMLQAVDDNFVAGQHLSADIFWLNSDRDALKAAMRRGEDRQLKEVWLKVRPSSPEGVRAWCDTVWWCVNPGGSTIWGDPAVRDALLAMAPHATTSNACQQWCYAVSWIVGETPGAKPIFATPAMRQVLEHDLVAVAQQDMSDWGAEDKRKETLVAIFGE